MAKKNAATEPKTRAKRAKTAVAAYTRRVEKKAPSAGPVIKKAVKTLLASMGALEINDAQAAKQLRELGRDLEHVAQALQLAEDRKDSAKDAQKDYEALVNRTLEKLRSFTHPKAMPLFDAEEREADQREMLAAAESGD